MGRLVVDELEGGGGLAEAVLNGGGTKGVPEGLDCCEGMEVLLSLLRLNNLSRDVIEDEDIGGEREDEKETGGRGGEEERRRRRRWWWWWSGGEAKREVTTASAGGTRLGLFLPAVGGERATRQTQH
jgi:hypothetical protein